MDVRNTVDQAANDLELLVSDDYYGMCSNCWRLLSFSELSNPDGGLNYPDLYCPECGENVSQTWDFSFHLWTETLGGLDSYCPFEIQFIIDDRYSYLLYFNGFWIDTFKQEVIDATDGFVRCISDEATLFLEREIEKEFGTVIDELIAEREFGNKSGFVIG